MITGKQLGRKVLEVIEADPDKHDQRWYESPCGTSYCIAGWAIALNTRPSESQFAAKNRIARELRLPTPEDEWWDIDDVALALLQIPRDQGLLMFWDMNDESALVRLRELVGE